MQDEAISQMMAIANCDASTARTHLEACNWDVSAALSLLYDSHPSDQPSPTSPRTPIRQSSGLSYYLVRLNRIFARPLGLLTLPFSILYNVIISVLGLFARLFGLRPNLASISLRRAFSNQHAMSRLDPTSAAERWVNSLYEQIGSIAASTAHNVPSSSTASQPRKLPDFFRGSYNDALKKAKEELRVLCVVLTSEEHDHSTHFTKTVLTDSDLISLLHTQNMLVWGGDVRYRDAHLTSSILQATTYPFIAFIAQLPTRLPGATNPPLKMQVLSVLEGSPHSTTSASSIITHINTTVIPRSSAYLNRLRNEQATRLRERQLREEQDAAYAEAGRRDRERVQAKERELAAAKQAQLDRERQQKEQVSKAENIRLWRAWATKHLLKAEPSGSEDTIKIVIRLGDGRRLVRVFSSGDSLYYVFAWIECTASSTDITSAATAPPQGYEHEFPFRVASLFPRKEIDKDNLQLKIKDFLGADAKEASLVVEGWQKEDVSSEDEEIVE